MNGRIRSTGRAALLALALALLAGCVPAAGAGQEEPKVWIYEKVIPAGKSFAVWNDNISGNGSMSGGMGIYVHDNACTYDLVYASGTPDDPETRMMLHKKGSAGEAFLPREPFQGIEAPTKYPLSDLSTFIRKSSTANQGMLAAVSVNTSSVLLRVRCESARPSLVLTQFPKPISLVSAGKKKAIDFIQRAGDQKRIPVLMCGTVGSKVKHTIDPQTNSYDSYKFTSSGVSCASYVQGKKAASKNIPYISSFSDNTRSYFTVMLLIDNHLETDEYPVEHWDDLGEGGSAAAAGADGPGLYGVLQSAWLQTISGDIRYGIFVPGLDTDFEAKGNNGDLPHEWIDETYWYRDAISSWDRVYTEDGTEEASGLHTVVVEGGLADRSVAEAGETVTVTAEAPEGAHFTGWTGDGAVFADAEAPVTTFEMPDRDVYVKANSEPEKFRVSVSAEHGTAAADMETAVPGETVTLTLTPEDGYELHTLTVTAGEQQEPVETVQDPLDPSKRRFVMPAGDVQAAALFHTGAHSIHVFAEHGYAQADRENASIGETVTVTLSKSEANWRPGLMTVRCNGAEVPAEKTGETEFTQTWTFVMPGDDVYVNAAFGRFFIVAFLDWNGSMLQWKDAEEGALPEYTGEPPEREPSALYTYTFAGWDRPIAPAAEHTSYTAVYDRAPRRYAVRWLDWDGTELQRGEYAYGDDPEYTGEPPVKAPDEQGAYYFKGWSPEPGSVTADAAYTAVYGCDPVLKTGDNTLRLERNVSRHFLFTPAESGYYRFHAGLLMDAAVQIRDDLGAVVYRRDGKLTDILAELEAGRTCTLSVYSRDWSPTLDMPMNVSRVDVYGIEFGEGEEESHGDIFLDELEGWPGRQIRVEWWGSDEGWVLTDVIVTDAAGNRIPYEHVPEDPFYMGFRMPASDVTVTPVFERLVNLGIVAGAGIEVVIMGGNAYGLDDGFWGVPAGKEVIAYAEDSETWKAGIPVSCAVITESGKTVPYTRKSETYEGETHWSVHFAMPAEAAKLYVAKAPDVPAFGGADLMLPPAERIEASAFEGDTALKSAYVPDGCSFIGDGAFRGCSGLVKIRVPRNCAFGDSVFAGCPALTAVYGPAGGTSEAWAIENGVPYAED